MDIRCIALDMDFTTLNAKGEISFSNRKAIEYALIKGIHIVVASGRAMYSLPKDILNISGIEYAITSNGAAAFHLPTGECLYQYLLSGASVKQIINITKEEPVAYEVFIDGTAYADAAYVNDPVRFGTPERAVEYIRQTRRPVSDIIKFINENLNCLESMDIVVDSQELKKSVWGILQEKVKEVYITSSIEQLIEISHKNSGKQSGIRFLMERLGLKREQIAAFGDGNNDIEMLSYVGIGIAMENATIACKKAAKYITLDHDEDGVAFGIHHILNL